MRRAVWVVLVVIGLGVSVSVASLGFAYLLLSREPSVPRQSTLVLRPGGDLPEVAPEVLGPFLATDTMTVGGMVEMLGKAKRDPRVSSVLLMPRALDAPYWAKLQEVRDAVLDFRTSGKTVVAFLEYGGNREYYLASAADQVFLLPTSELDVTGIASYEVFLQGALEKLGASADFVHIGEYKTAVNQLTERTLTPPHREMVESLNRDMYEQLVRGIAEARGLTETAVRALLDRGPFQPEAAREAGLVDGLAYEDELDDKVEALQPAPAGPRRIEGRDYQRTSARSVGLRPRSRIAVIYAVGAITSGRSGFDPINGPVVGSDTLVEQIRLVRADESIKAIVLRVDSPGGSSIASDVVWRELMITRDARPSVPLVTSMSDLAASGGYYIALPGQVIVAEPGTLTGSIGVYAGKYVVGGTLEKLGVAIEPVVIGRNADRQSPLQPYTTEQRETIQRSMQVFYDQFLRKVAESRKMPVDRVAAVAQGRVWTGRQARDRGLVDVLGGLDTAVRIAKERAAIPADEDVELVAFPARRGLYAALLEQFSGTRSTGPPWRFVGGVVEHAVWRAISAPARLFRQGEILALMPAVVIGAR